MNFFYQAGAMGYGGEGWLWHKFFPERFPDLPMITKTITLGATDGNSKAVLWFGGKSVWNRISLDNPGIRAWKRFYWENQNDLILSIHGDDFELQLMCNLVENIPLTGIEINMSCPNVKHIRNRKLPETKHPLYIKLNYLQDPFEYFHEHTYEQIERIHVNSIPKFFGGISGKMAQEKNWRYIEHNISRGLNVAGCSWYDMNDIASLKDMGCTHVGIASTMITNPKVIQSLGKPRKVYHVKY